MGKWNSIKNTKLFLGNEIVMVDIMKGIKNFCLVF